MGWCCSSVVTCLACGRPHFPALVPQRRKKRNGEGITYLVCDILGKLFNLYVSISSLRKWRNNSHLAECCKVWVRLYTMHSGRDKYVLMMAFLIKCGSLSEVTSIPELSDAIPCGEHLWLRHTGKGAVCSSIVKHYQGWCCSLVWKRYTTNYFQAKKWWCVSMFDLNVYYST